MSVSRFSSVIVVLLAGAAWCLPASAGTYTQLYGFTGAIDGAVPESFLTPDAAGDKYGTTSEGATICDADIYYGCGTIFRMDGSGHITTVYSFPGGADGGGLAAGVTLAQGTLYGGASDGTNGAGLLYSVKTDGSGFTVMHEFTGLDGDVLKGLLQPAVNGGFFGITDAGGPAYTSQGSGDGVLFFVRPNGVYYVAHRFGGSDGRDPSALLVYPSGNMLGSTFDGGGCAAKSGCGIIFEYAPATKTFSVLYTFQGTSDGSHPMLGSIGADGTLYGAAKSGGGHSHGTLFSLTPAGGTYTFATLASFTSKIDGDGPLAGPTLAHGALIGSTGSYIYSYKNGKLSDLAVYGSGGVPYLDPLAPLSVGAGGVISGTSYAGGVTPCTFSNGEKNIDGCGIIFSYAP